MKKDTPKYVLGLGVFLGCLFAVSSPLQAQSTTGVTDKEILIGSCSALEGPSHFLGTETVTGAKAYFAMINDAGGVDGRKLKLISYDDSYDPAKTEACFNRQQDSTGGAFHRSADAVRAAAPLDRERSRVLF
jgi:ABC-type branched-subunit amino acid transport system substrate-binding protein